MTRQTPSLLTLVREFDREFEELPAKRFLTTRAYHDFANDLIAVGISFRVKIIKKRRLKPSCIMVMLLQTVDMTKPTESPLEPHDHSQVSEDIPDTDSVDIIGACPSCGVLMANSEWCSYCGEDASELYSTEGRDESRH